MKSRAQLLTAFVLSVGITCILYYAILLAAEYKADNTPEKMYLEDRSEIYYPKY